MGNRLARRPALAIAFALLGTAFLTSPQDLQGQEVPAETAVQVEDERLDSFVRAHLEINEIRDQLHEDIARWHEDHRREESRQEADERIQAALEGHGVTSAEYEELIHLVSFDQEWREAFEEALTRVQGG